jgi:hypothetical protein
MKRRDFLEKWGLSSLKIKLPFLEGEFNPRDPDRAAAWELYVELLTRITTQYLPAEDGDEEAALQSVFVIFSLTREILRKHGSGAGEFAKLAIPVLNQIIRPFTAKWHRLSVAGAFKDREQCREFRAELSALRPRLRAYTCALADMAQVEDLTTLEETST